MNISPPSTFAHVTLRDRMPRILTQVIDTVNKEESVMNKKFGQVCVNFIIYITRKELTM